MNYERWARRWGLPRQALVELHQTLLLELSPEPGRTDSFVSEAAVLNNVRLEASRAGMRLWRNNVGAVHDKESGTYFRFGLANDSAAMNKRLKSGDLIGIRPIVIGVEHMGTTIGQFVSRECKAPGWRWAGTEREVAQAAWAQLINSFGGDAMIVSGEGSL